MKPAESAATLQHWPGLSERPGAHVSAAPKRLAPTRAHVNCHSARTRGEELFRFAWEANRDQTMRIGHYR